MPDKSLPEKWFLADFDFTGFRVNRSRPQLQKHELALLVNWGQERQLRSGPFYAFVVFR